MIVIKVLRNIMLILSIVLFLAMCAGIWCIYYAINIEPYKLEIENIQLSGNNQNTTDSFKVVQISDLHLKDQYTYNDLQKVVDKINEQSPDVVLFTGDLIDEYYYYDERENISNVLSNINAKYGKFAIYGNVDMNNYYFDTMENGGFTVLKNKQNKIELENGKSLLLIGLDSTYVGNPSMPQNLDSADYTILLTHEPDSIENYLDTDFDLALSGHSHGGQINIPFVPKVNQEALSTTKYAEKYSAGMYELTDGKKLYVNTGIGTTHVYVRFNVVPKITVFDINL